MRVYCLKNCDTCRKALAEMVAAGMTPEVIDVRADGVPEAKLAQFLETFGEALVNRRSTTWRGLSEMERLRPPLELLAENPTLMKRPAIDMGDALYLGWDAKTRAAVLG